MPSVKKNHHDFSNVTAFASRCPRKASFCDAIVASVESSIKIVDDDDSTGQAGILAPLCFKFKLSIM